LKKLGVSTVFALLFQLLSAGVVVADVTISQHMIVEGHEIQTTVYLRGPMERTETTLAPGMKIVTIKQCDRERMIQINDRTKSYLITLLGDDAPVTKTGEASAETITFTQNVQDTGERKQLFGYTARRIKSEMTSDAGANSCVGDMKVSSDGWYVDLPNTSCKPNPDSNLRTQGAAQACGANFRYKITGSAKLGYPVMLESAIQSKGHTTQVRQETTKVEATDLNVALFQVPQDYREVKTYAELMGVPGMVGTAGMAAMQPRSGKAQSPQEEAAEANKTAAKRPGTIRIGVLQFTSSVEQPSSMKYLQGELIRALQSLGTDAVPLVADPKDRDAVEAESQSKECDYFVYSDISSIKQPNSAVRKVGGVLGHGIGAGTTDVTVSVQAFLAGQMRPVLDGSNNFKSANADLAFQGLTQTEAKSIATEIKKVKP
jgi:Domain of unknown function (DUF4412)